MGFIFSQLAATRGSSGMTTPPRLTSMTVESQRRELANTDEVTPTTIVLEYGESSFELVVGPLYKAYDENGEASWWVGDRLVGTARGDASPIVPVPSLVFIRAGWQYPLSDLMLGAAA